MSIIQGKHSVNSAIQAGVNLEFIGIKRSYDQKLAGVAGFASNQKIPVHLIDDKDFDRQYGTTHTQGIVAKVKGQLYKTEIKEIEQQHELPRIILAVDHLEDPYNFGSIMRTCECLGVNTMIFPKDRQAQIQAGVVQASSGAIYFLDIYKVVNVGQAITYLKNLGYWVYGTDVENGQAYFDVEYQYPCVIVLGNEAKGQSKRIGKLVDQNIHIPMQGHTQSMNVSVSGGIVLAEVTKQLFHS